MTTKNQRKSRSLTTVRERRDRVRDDSENQKANSASQPGSVGDEKAPAKAAELQSAKLCATKAKRRLASGAKALIRSVLYGTAKAVP